MQTVVLESKDASGASLKAVFAPSKGMNLISYQRDGVEVIDPSTQNLFEERAAGLGSLIGPHFHRRKSGTFPKVKEEGKFPHIAKVRANGVEDPFSHGIARYAPWKVTAGPSTLEGTLEGKDEWEGVPLSELQGQNFKMRFDAELLASGLKIRYSVCSDWDSIVGFHYYYRLPKGKAVVESRVKPDYLDQGEVKKIPDSWDYSSSGDLNFDLEQEADYSFHPYPSGSGSQVRLKTSEYQIQVDYKANSQENCWQLFRPKSSFVCIEPISAINPRKPVLTVSSLEMNLQILSSVG